MVTQHYYKNNKCGCSHTGLFSSVFNYRLLYIHENIQPLLAYQELERNECLANQREENNGNWEDRKVCVSPFCLYHADAPITAAARACAFHLREDKQLQGRAETLTDSRARAHRDPLSGTSGSLLNSQFWRTDGGVSRLRPLH